MNTQEMKPLKKGIRLRWEKRTGRGVRYYEVDLRTCGVSGS